MTTIKPKLAARMTANGKEARYEDHEVFGWTVRRNLWQAGASFDVAARVEIARESAPNRAMYVRGRCTVTNNGVNFPDRVPGLYTQERPAHPVGTTRIKAVEDTEMWCFDAKANNGQVPELTPVRLVAGDVLALSAGALLFVMHGTAGTLVGPCTHVPEAAATLEVTEDLYAFIVAEAR